MRRRAPKCSAYSSWTLGQLRSLRPDAILVAARGDLDVNPIAAQSVDDEWHARASRVLTVFRAITPHLIVFGDVVGRSSQPAGRLTHLGYAEADCLHPPLAAVVGS